MKAVSVYERRKCQRAQLHHKIETHDHYTGVSKNRFVPRNILNLTFLFRKMD